MPLRPNMEPMEYLDIVRRKKWLVVFSFLGILFAGIVYCVVTPELYKSSTTILVVPQRVPESYVHSTVTVRIEDRLATLQQQVMSRTRLMTIADELGLFKEERKAMAPEAVVALIQGRIDIQVRGNDGFTLSFLHEDRQTAMLVASRLASLFIDENLKTREQQAVGTSEFLDSQLQDTKQKLEAAEEKVKKYKMQYMGELPQETEANLNMLTRLQDQLRTNADAVRAAEDRKVFTESQAGVLERSSRRIVHDDGRVEDVSASDPTQALYADLAARRTRLAELSARYTDRYPELQRTRLEIDEIEKRIAEIRDVAPSTDNTARRSVSSTRSAVPPQNSVEIRELARLRAQVASAVSEIAGLRRERESIQRNIAAIQAKVERAPRREQEMIALTRDYENLRRSYDELMRNKLQADVSQNLERRQKGEQFQILDSANLPGAPFKPDRIKILGLSFVVACLVGFGGAIGLEMIDQTLRGTHDFRHFFGLPVLACIPAIQDKRFGFRKKIRNAAVIGGVMSFAAIAILFIILYKDKIRTILQF